MAGAEVEDAAFGDCRQRRSLRRNVPGHLRTTFAARVRLLIMPTLIVGGRRDAYFEAEAVAHLARSLPCDSAGGFR